MGVNVWWATGDAVSFKDAYYLGGLYMGNIVYIIENYNDYNVSSSSFGFCLQYFVCGCSSLCLLCFYLPVNSSKLLG